MNLEVYDCGFVNGLHVNRTGACIADSSLRGTLCFDRAVGISSKQIHPRKDYNRQLPSDPVPN